MRAPKTIWAMVRDAHVWNAAREPNSAAFQHEIFRLQLHDRVGERNDAARQAGTGRLDQAGASIVQPQEVGLDQLGCSVFGAPRRGRCRGAGLTGEIQMGGARAAPRKPIRVSLLSGCARASRAPAVGCLAVLAALQDGAAQEWGLPAHECCRLLTPPLPFSSNRMLPLDKRPERSCSPRRGHRHHRFSIRWFCAGARGHSFETVEASARATTSTAELRPCLSCASSQTLRCGRW